ncbi:MAG: GNAT family N-acetyltransferase [Thioclava marina]|uniref:L-ornithine N(alpha)-acyltransferase n=1 Tax=Thioclava marina TaxID=1915077 RepID=A0ABX3MLB2_9RHOB|nr:MULTISPECIES: GNAT family N-acyltransferase [Thioclava]TNE88837.1 MAG: GNAT family N-acetyltransferase [Paracoccaceae bacterium]MBC7144204.1 GNAT family N-acetyltransferase [Thioclava marina]MBD3803504.1 GNAT family N-acetyltransferase [Thioclava sp.]OOY12296.1 ornithine-acyl-ACP acyltransferase [Thioclava marina]OOY28270.1 ornithine-acyl-ACP acyltransferase [Thioclava sp. L04-15]
MSENAAFDIRLARGRADLEASQRLRYRVFVEELGGGGQTVDHDARIERDDLDPVYDHLLLVDRNRPEGEHVVGAYRLLTSDRAAEAGHFYCDAEYDLGPLRASGRKLLELGRSCVHPDYRGGAAMLLLWNALADYVLAHEVEILFGVASFHGTDPQALKMPLAWLHHHHLAPEALRARARPEAFQRMDLVSEADLDRRAAMAQMPNLIKAYLRLGGFVGEGAFIDHPFNTTDVLLLMDTKAMSDKHRAFYTRRFEGKG